MTLDGLTASVDEAGTLILTDPSGNVVGGAAPALMWGASRDPGTGDPVVQEQVPTTLLDGPGGPVLELTPDYSDPALDYPVMIDPAVDLTLAMDTFIDSSHPNTSYGTAYTLRAGKWTSGAVYRSLIGFDPSALTSAMGGDYVVSASLALTETGSGSCDPTPLDLYSVTGTVPFAPTWNTQPGVGQVYASASAAMGYSTSCPAGTLTLSDGGAGGTSLRDLVQS